MQLAFVHQLLHVHMVEDLPTANDLMMLAMLLLIQTDPKGNMIILQHVSAAKVVAPLVSIAAGAAPPACAM